MREEEEILYVSFVLVLVLVLVLAPWYCLQWVGTWYSAVGQKYLRSSWYLLVAPYWDTRTGRSISHFLVAHLISLISSRLISSHLVSSTISHQPSTEFHNTVLCCTKYEYSYSVQIRVQCSSSSLTPSPSLNLLSTTRTVRTVLVPPIIDLSRCALCVLLLSFFTSAVLVHQGHPSQSDHNWF